MKKQWVYSLIFATIMVLLPMSSLFYAVSQKMNDGLYQQMGMTHPDICIIGIDAESIDTLGSFPFDRGIYADLFEILNQSEVPPLAIAVDVLFTGETDEENDRALVESATKWDNIIFACSGNYGTQLLLGENGDISLSNSSLLSMNHPFPDLLEVATLGHINSNLDGDGMLRHGLLSIENEEGEAIPSLSLSMYLKYCENQEISVNIPSENKWYIPFTAKSGGYFDGYSLSKVLSGEIPASVFANKLVFLGPYTIGLQDHFYTAIDHYNLMYGVEYQANSLEALINQQFITIIPSIYHHIFLFVVTALLFVLTFHKKLRFSGSVLFLTSVFYVILCKTLYDFSYLCDVFYLPLSCCLMYLFHIIVNAMTERLEKAKVTASFRKYVAPEVVDQLFKDGMNKEKLGGEITDVSVMFIDVRNFTPMSEKFKDDPKTLLDILNRLLNSMAGTVMENGGTLDKFIGDAIMCFWGAPLPQEDYVYKSVKTAVEITENLEPIIQEIKKDYQHDVSVGIGIHCGSAVVGNIGSESRMDYTVIGDTVNTAARLEANAKGGHNVIIISDEVYQKVSASFAVETIEGGLVLKGKEDIFTAYRVLGRL